MSLFSVWNSTLSTEFSTGWLFPIFPANIRFVIFKLGFDSFFRRILDGFATNAHINLLNVI